MKTIITLLATLVSATAIAQNISNPDFETYSSCPTQQTNLSYALRATDWIRPTAGTSDYFNSCGFSIASHISAYSGSGFVGGYMELRNNPVVNYKEYLTNHLSTPLVAGLTYTFSFYTAHIYGASPAGMMPILSYVDLPAAEQGFIGVVFSSTAPANANTETGSSNYGSIVNTFGSGRVMVPASNTDVYGAASRNTWVKVTLQYTAAGGEEYMTFGQFRPGASSLSNAEGVYYLFDGFDPALSINPLPVTLKYFTAEKEGAAAQLNWVSLNERDLKGFELQRSSDGKKWNAIGFISSRATGGNSTSELPYSFKDDTPLEGINFYRLSQLDRDGHQEYSKVQTLSFGTGNTSISIYPNPVLSTISINGLSGNSTIKLININGATVREGKATTPVAQIDMASIPAGVYYLQIINEEAAISTFKVIKE
ncbi:MAG: hypothetical protein BGO31_17090 [Bacteroidetes bacterium 43-16]|nr:MAG: hypothetical protein BGO31_17090 [Bacteroidetes bacterium 43-16]